MDLLEKCRFLPFPTHVPSLVDCACHAASSSTTLSSKVFVDIRHIKFIVGIVLRLAGISSETSYVAHSEVITDLDYDFFSVIEEIY
jgi:hypothetical protein